MEEASVEEAGLALAATLEASVAAGLAEERIPTVAPEADGPAARLYLEQQEALGVMEATEVSASVDQAPTWVVQAPVVVLVRMGSGLQAPLPSQAQLEWVVVEEEDDAVELAESPVQWEEAPREVQVAASTMTQETLVKVTAAAEGIRPVPAEAPAMVLEAELEFFRRTGDPMADYLEALREAAMEEMMMVRLERELEHLVELVEP